MAVNFLESERESFPGAPREFVTLLAQVTLQRPVKSATCEMEARARRNFGTDFGSQRPGKKFSGADAPGSMRKYGMSTEDEVQ